MELKIAGERIFITVPFSDQDFVRDTEKSVEAHYSQWRHDFPKKNSREILAMMTYQYASFYFELLNRVNSAKDLLRLANSSVDSIIAGEQSEIVPD